MNDTSYTTQEPAPTAARRFAEVLRRRRFLLFGTLITALVAGVVVPLFVNRMLPPRYRATARLLVEPHPHSVQTQADLLRSSEMAQKLAGRLDGRLPRRLFVSAAPDKAIIDVTAEDSSGAVAARAANALVKMYAAQEEAPDAAATPAASYRKVRQEIDALRARAAVLRDRLAEEAAFTAGSDLRDEIDFLENQRNRLLAENQPVTAAVAGLDARIAAARARLVQEHAAAAARAESPDPEGEALRNRLIDLEARLSTLAALAADSSQRLAASGGEAAERARARVIDAAEVPATPVRPDMLGNLARSLLIGLLLGLFFALLAEALDDRIYSAAEADRAFGLPSLGQVPAIQEKGLRLIRDLQTFSPITESYRALRTNLFFAAWETNAQTFAVLSSVPGEGKSTTVVNLAMAMALGGKRVLVVDADLRRPTLHTLLGVPAAPGLADYLLGTCALGEAVRPTGIDRVGLVPAGTAAARMQAADLLGSLEKIGFLESARALADVVLFDSPPVLAVGDAVLLAATVDGVIFVIASGETRKREARQALRLLRQARAPLLGCVVNKLVRSENAYYGAYDYRPAEAPTPPPARREIADTDDPLSILLGDPPPKPAPRPRARAQDWPWNPAERAGQGEDPPRLPRRVVARPPDDPPESPGQAS